MLREIATASWAKVAGSRTVAMTSRSKVAASLTCWQGNSVSAGFERLQSPIKVLHALTKCLLSAVKLYSGPVTKLHIIIDLSSLSWGPRERVSLPEHGSRCDIVSECVV